MISRERFMATAAWLFLVGSPILAADVYVVRFFTGPLPASTSSCTDLAYRDALVFFNASSTDATASLLGVSNGTAAQPQPLTIEAGATRSSRVETAAQPRRGPRTLNLSCGLPISMYRTKCRCRADCSSSRRIAPPAFRTWRVTPTLELPCRWFEL